MKTVGLKVLKNKLSEYVRIAASGETVQVTGRGASLRNVVQDFFARVPLLDLSEDVLARAVEPYPVPVRTLDGLHLATIEYLRSKGESIRLATYDARLTAAARALGIAIYAP